MVVLTKDGRAAKTGFCQPCRDGHCNTCASDDCTCPDRRKHRARPGFASIDGNGNGGVSSSVRRLAEANGTTPRRPERALAAPLWELVRSDPPEHTRRSYRKTVVEQARPFLEQLMAEGDHEWHRLVLFPSAAAAAMNAWRLEKAYGEFEWDSHRIDEVDQSAIWVRWNGGGAKVPA